MTSLQILADDQSELLVGGARAASGVGPSTATETFSRNNTELLSRNVINTAVVLGNQQNFAITAGVGVGIGVGGGLGAASSTQSNTNGVAIAQRGA